VHVAELIPIDAEPLHAAVARFDVEHGTTVERYQVPLLVRVEGDDATLVDATEDASFRDWLGRALASGARIDAPQDDESRQASWIVERIGTTTSAAAPSRVGSAEQSNTSIIYGDAAIFKLFRRLEPGTNPDVEIAGFLTTRTSFRHTPALLGVARYASADGWSAVAGMLQPYLSGSVDAWSYALERGRRYFRAPPRQQPPNEFAADAQRLGRITRELHEALASRDDVADFAPQAATADDVRQWREGTTRTIRDALALLRERSDARALPPPRLAEASVILRRADEYLGDVDRIAAELASDGSAGQRIRHHGDLHLGQVLRTADGDFMVIDFEGEPSRPLAERRARHSALRDVAGMLRSFAYAAATLATEITGSFDKAMVETRSARWERETRDAFLIGYLQTNDGRARFLPTSRHLVDRLLSLFEMEKVFYELTYELNNRPDWVWIPMRGIARLTTAPRPRS
jgi:trehalose synthase-fused probable maltokinase